MEKELCCFFIYSVDRVLRAAAPMDGRGTTCSSNDRCIRGIGEEWEEDRNTNREKTQKSGKTLKNHLTTVGECGILSELQESSAQVEAKRGKSKVPKERSEKNLKKV